MGQRMTGRIVTPLKRLGGKTNLSEWIIQNLPAHTSYVEVFGGSAAVLFRKEQRPEQEVYNDRDKLWVNSFKVLRDHGDELADTLALTPYARAEFEECQAAIRQWKEGEITIPPLELARMHVVIIRQAVSADGGWSRCREEGARPRLWSRLPSEFRRCAARLKDVFIEDKDYRELLSLYDQPRAVFYIDPPYFGVEHDYYDVNKDDGFNHAALRDAVQNLQGSVVISYYAGEEIESLYQGWEIIRKPSTVHSSRDRHQETEILLIRRSEFDLAVERKTMFSYDELEDEAA